MQFSINDLDLKQLEHLGITKKDILNLPPRQYNALFSGKRTGLFHFKNMNIPGLKELDAKLSVKRKPDGGASLALHPIQKVAKNVFDLNPDQIDTLNKEGTEWIDKKMKDKNGIEENYLVTLDKETNEYVALKKSTINAPDEINGQKLNDDQKKNFVEGNEVDVEGEKFKLSPNEIGVQGSDGNTLFKSAEFKNVKYNRNELLFDLALILSGAAPWLLIGGAALTLMKGLINSAAKSHSIPGRSGYTNFNEKELKTAVQRAKPQLEQLIKSDKKNLTQKDFQNVFNSVNQEQQQTRTTHHRR